MDRAELSAQPAWAPPRDFDEYRLVRLLGRGAMGQVYLAHDTLLDRQVAIKFIATARPAPRARERLLIEARAIARLQHPNVVAIHRAGEVDGRPYLVSEFLHGQSLAEAARPMPSARVLLIGLCLARGLSAAHRRGVLHRDIKPANVMILPDGEAKLLDFGLAKLLDPGPAPPMPVSPLSSRPAAADGAARGLDETASLDETSGTSASGTGPAGNKGPTLARPLSLTGQGEILGTPLYMAPEVWCEGPVTPRSDVYSLGALLFELCTGRPPHREETLAALGDAILGRDAPDLAALAPDLDPRLCAVIQRCLRREPAARFASGEELAQALQEIEARAVAPPAGNPYRGLRAFEAEHRALFFGRGAEVRAVLEQLRAEPLVLLAGDSGVGKSSLCRAGVLPLICEGALLPGDGRRWSVAALLPGRRPLQALADALPRDLADPGLLPLLREQPAVEAGRALRQRLGERAGVVVFIDQMEELLTQSEPDEALLFSAIIGELGARVPGMRVLATARGDALTRLSALPGLGPTLARAVHVVRPLSRDELCEAVLGPARAMGFGFETEALVEELVRYAAGAEGGLPLLQFALAELWEARDPDRGIIPATALARIGGVAGALSRHADAVLAGLLPEQRAAARRILTHLVTVQGRRVRRTEEELRAGSADVAALESLVRGRLLLAREAEGRTVYEVAHEALAQGWATLRRWLAADEDRRVAWERLAAAAAEWERLGRARDSLWGERQLAEARAVGLGLPDGGALTLGPRERAFLLASQRDLSRRRWTRRGLILGAPLILALAYGGFALQARQRMAREIAGHMDAADALLHRAHAANGVVAAQRQVAFARFDLGDRDGGEAEWARARQLAEGAEDLYAQVSAELDAALLLDDRDAAVHRRLAAALYERALLAERDHRRAQLDQLLTWLGRHDLDGAWHRRFRAPARLVLRGLPAGVAVMVQRYEDHGGVRVLGAPVRLPAGGVVEKELAPGSYLLHLSAPGRAPVRHPVLLGRDERREVWGVMPAVGAVPPGMVYVPAGRFLYGSTAEEELRRDMLKAPPLHTMEGGAYLIGRTEVTFAAWIEYLRAVGREERAARLPRSGDGVLALRELPDGTFQLSLRPTTQVYTAREGEKIRYPGRVRRATQDWLRMPVSGISWDDAWAYADWLRRSGRLPGARLCTEMEWERAARGADDRSYPHGDLLAADDANHDRTYGRHPLGFGPDEVGSHPLSDSPFSVADLAGNVWEMVRGTGGEIVFASGSWYKEALVSAATNRNFGERSMRHVLIGLRLCADPR